MTTEQISQSVLTELKKYDQTACYLEGVQSAKKLSEVSLKIRDVVLTRISEPQSSSGGPQRIKLRSFPYITSGSTKLLSLEFLENLIAEIESYNNTRPESSLNSFIQKHAQARLLLFYQTCAAYYETKPEQKIKIKGTDIQIRVGAQTEHTEACHHAIGCTFDDRSVMSYLERKLDSSRYSEWLVKELLFLGVPVKAIETKDVPPLPHTLIDKHTRLYYLNSHTLVAPGPLNTADDLIENELSYKAETLLNECAQGTKTPLEATKELGRVVQESISALVPRVENLTKEIKTLEDQLRDVARWRRDFASLGRKLSELKTSVENVKDKVADTRNKGGYEIFSQFSLHAKSIVTKIDETIFQYEEVCRAQPNFEEMADQHATLEFLDEVCQLVRSPGLLEKKNKNTLTEEDNAKVLKIATWGTQLRLRMLLKEREAAQGREVKDKISDLSDRIGHYTSLLSKIQNGQPLSNEQRMDILKNFDRGISREGRDALLKEILPLRDRVGSFFAPLWRTFEQHFGKLTEVISQDILEVLSKSQERKTASIPTLQKTIEFLKEEKAGSAQILEKLPKMERDKVDYRIQRLFVISHTVNPRE